MSSFLKSFFMFILKSVWVLLALLLVGFITTGTEAAQVSRFVMAPLVIGGSLWIFARIIGWPKSIAGVKSIKAEKKRKKKVPLKHHSWAEELLQREELTKQWKELACK